MAGSRCAAGTARCSGRPRSPTSSGSTTTSGRRCARAYGCTCARTAGRLVPSSGIDSTAVVALAREFNPNILTFTVGYDVPGYSEIDVAQDSARHLDVTTIPTKIGPQDMIDALPKIVWHLDDPVADPALVPLYFVAKKAAEHVTVVLSGEGRGRVLRRLHHLPGAVVAQRGQQPARRRAEGPARGVQGDPAGRQGQELPGARHHPDRGALLRQRPDVHRGGEAAPAAPLRPSVRYTDVTAPIYAECTELDDVTKMQYVDLYTWLRGDILVKADRISMAHSLEVRVPFLDREVFNVAAGIPVDLKLPPRSEATKYAMRQALQGVVPPAIVNRKKLGFPTPTRVWLRGEMYEWARHVLSTSGAGDLIDLSYAMRLLDEHKREEADHSRKVWTVLIFRIWHRHLRGQDARPGHPAQPVRAAHQPVVGSMVR
ncbi:asparagine synthase C-terminal domain-containing protein [Micromonospora sp. BRA006-A]|nr:asparagine synthase C-terminal domain-containing protein [Micromonospora sp. BRA006-A]